MKTVYFISKFNSEYNDEIYSISDGGTVVKTFSDKNIAEKECLKLNIEEYKNLRPYEYSYDTIEDFDIIKLNKIFKKSWIRSAEVVLPNNITLEQYKEAHEIVNIKFYEVIQIEVSDE